MSAPTIPPRPSRSTQNQSPGSSNLMDVPKIPPRPNRSIDRSVSPNRDTFARSPLNDPSFLHKDHHKGGSHLSHEVPDRPPSVSLPTLGQEGSEYASFEDLSKTLTQGKENSPQQTKNVAGDLPLHAPKASVPSSTAASRIQTVTRTDSSQAAAAGVGSLAPDDRSVHPESGHSDSSAGNRSRPSSMYREEEEQGIPEIGVQVPMYPNAGDVQAPTPAPYDPSSRSTHMTSPERPRHHGRTKSGREIFHGPPGSYGLHGHGVGPVNEFDKQWYAKHPEDLKREKEGEYGPHVQVNRKDYHWMGDDLAKLVHSSGDKGIGMGTSRDAIGTPDESIGYRASEEFASRMASPRPGSGHSRPVSKGKSAVNVESPLHHRTDSTEEVGEQTTKENEAEDVIHIDEPTHPASKIHGGGYDPPVEDLRAHGGNTAEEGGWVTEQGHGMPILASDEVQKYPGGRHRQPAVDPELERRRSGDYTLNETLGQPAYITKQRTHSRSSSRNNSVQSPKLQRFASPTEHDRTGTPLESTKEYEPLFPEDDEEHKKPRPTDKRPHLAPRHHFPSQDVWEDSPSSHHLETTVETPQAPEEPQEHEDAPPVNKTFEKPEDEETRKDTVTKEDQQSFLPEHTKRFANKHLKNVETRPGMQQRFPSHDIWEDAPDHGQLVTTVSAPQSEDTSEYADDASSPVDKPSVPARPSIPARPQKPKEMSPVDKKAPQIPERPKPQVPARPSKTISSENVPTVDSQGEAAPQPKAKPPVPARPGGSKIAALQAGFLKDLNSKLGLGPQAPKVKEPEPEAEEEAPKPLQDARKGRAKGPQRRKPQSSPSPAAAVVSEVAVSAPQLKLSDVTTVWSIGDDGEVDAPAAQMAAKIQEAVKSTKAEPVAPQTETSDDLTPVQSNTSEIKEDVAATSDALPAAKEKSVPEPTETEQDLAPTTSIESSKAASDEPELSATGGVPLETESGPHVTLPGSTVESESPEAKIPSSLEESAVKPSQDPIIAQEPVAAERTVAAAEGEEREVSKDAGVPT